MILLANLEHESMLINNISTYCLPRIEIKRDWMFWGKNRKWISLYFHLFYHGCSTCNTCMCDQCTYQVVLWTHTFLCFLFSLAILGFPSLPPSSFPLPASLLLLQLPIAPTGSSTWCSWRWRNVCSTCGVEKGGIWVLLLQLKEVWPCDSCQHSVVSWSAMSPQAYSILPVKRLHRLTQYCLWM